MPRHQKLEAFKEIKLNNKVANKQDWFFRADFFEPDSISLISNEDLVLELYFLESFKLLFMGLMIIMMMKLHLGVFPSSLESSSSWVFWILNLTFSFLKNNRFSIHIEKNSGSTSLILLFGLEILGFFSFFPQIEL